VPFTLKPWTIKTQTLNPAPRIVTPNPNYFTQASLRAESLFVSTPASVCI